MDPGGDEKMKFSVCIPNYNYERYLGLTIKSVLEQPDADIEMAADAAVFVD